MVASFMKIDGRVREKQRDNGAIRLVTRKVDVMDTITVSQEQDIGGKSDFENDRILLNIKRKRVDGGT